MIYLERVITVKTGSATMNEPIVLYKGDKNVEIQFEIKNNPFKTKSGIGITHSQLIIDRKSADSVFSEVERLSNNKVIFVISGDMIDELYECNDYDFQIRLYNDEQSSRATLPPIIKGIQVKEPICEDESVGTGGADDLPTTEGEEVEIFDEEGNYNKTDWNTGDMITSQSLNKFEGAIDYLVTESKTHATETYVEERATGLQQGIELLTSDVGIIIDTYATKDELNNTLGDIEDLLGGI